MIGKLTEMLADIETEDNSHEQLYEEIGIETDEAAGVEMPST